MKQSDTLSTHLSVPVAKHVKSANKAEKTVDLSNYSKN